MSALPTSGLAELNFMDSQDAPGIHWGIAVKRRESEFAWASHWRLTWQRAKLV